MIVEEKTTLDMQERLERKKRLLQLARRSRSKWIMDASKEDESVRREVISAREEAIKLTSTVNSGNIVANSTPSSTSLVVNGAIPGQSCIQTVLDFLSDAADDAEYVDVETLAMTLPDLEDDEEYDGSSDDASDDSSDEDEEESSNDDEGGLQDAMDDDDDKAFTDAKRAAHKEAKRRQKEKTGIKTTKNKGKNKDSQDPTSLHTLYADYCGAVSADGTTIQVPQVAFIEFLKRFRKQDMDVIAIVKSVQLFVTRLQQEAIQARVSPTGDFVRTADDRHTRWASEIWAFIATTTENMRKIPHWAVESADVFAQTAAFFEKFLYIKLHPLLYSNANRTGSHTKGADSSNESASGGLSRIASTSHAYESHGGYAVDASILRQDEALYNRMLDLDFLTPAHLDIHSLGGPGATSNNSNNDGNIDDWKQYFDEPVKWLNRLIHYRWPVDIIRVLRNSTVAIAEALKKARPDVHAPGADELLPMMVLALQLAKPRGLHSCIQYIQRYTPRSKLDSEAGYLLTQIMSAVQFLEIADESMLTISPREFERNLRECHAIAQEKMNVLASSPKVGTITNKDITGKINNDSDGNDDSTNPVTGRLRTMSAQETMARKQRNAKTMENMVKLSSESGMFSNSAEEMRFIEALASANTDNNIHDVWNKHRKNAAK